MATKTSIRKSLMSTRSLGIDIGGTKARYGVLNKDSLHDQGSEVSRPQTPETLTNQCREIADRFKNIKNVGIAIPGPLDRDGILHHPPNFPHWGRVNFKALLRKTLKHAFVLERDSVAALVAEWKLGVAKDKHNVVLLTIGTGIGGAAIVDGKLLRGHHGFSGELGHVYVGPHGRTCGLGHDGCVEAWASGKALEDRVPLETATHAFAHLLRSMELAFDPELIVLTGGMSQFEAYVASALQKVKLIGLHTDVKVGKFGEWAGVVGAALLAQDHS